MPRQEELTIQEKDNPSDSNPAPPGSVDPKQKKVAITDVMQVFGDRGFVRSTLENVFLTSSTSPAAKTTFYSTVDSILNSNAGEFGGAMNVYSTLGLREDPTASHRYRGSMLNDSMVELPTNGPASPARIAIMNDVCRKLMNVSDDYLLAALANAGVSAPATTAPSVETIRALYALFSPGRRVDSSIIDSMLGVDGALVQKNSTISMLERWRAATYLICSDPYWQAL
ncbi:MAG: hypothetical protein HC902_06760 [Calothrix sp. SM1_5_4]|nr:hypothetical protein [Calothrix sp. SM1_5_4]